MARVLCVLALLCFASCVAETTETEQRFKDLQLQQDSLSWLDKLQDKQESTKRQTILEMFYKLFKSESGITLQEPKDSEKKEKNRRGLGGMTTRRAGCRVFFWKTLTSC